MLTRLNQRSETVSGGIEQEYRDAEYEYRIAEYEYRNAEYEYEEMQEPRNLPESLIG
jgi:hypothetical protein